MIGLHSPFTHDDTQRLCNTAQLHMKIHNACVTQPITRKTVTHALCNTSDYTSKLHNPVTHRLCNTKHFLCNTIVYTTKLHNTSYTPVTHSVQSNSACYSLCFVAVDELKARISRDQCAVSIEAYPAAELTAIGLPVRADGVIAQYSRYRHMVHSLCSGSLVNSSRSGTAAAKRAKCFIAERSFRREDRARTVSRRCRAPRWSHRNILTIWLCPSRRGRRPT